MLSVLSVLYRDEQGYTQAKRTAYPLQMSALIQTFLVAHGTNCPTFLSSYTNQIYFLNEKNSSTKSAIIILVRPKTEIRQLGEYHVR